MRIRFAQLDHCTADDEQRRSYEARVDRWVEGARELRGDEAEDSFAGLSSTLMALDPRLQLLPWRGRRDVRYVLSTRGVRELCPLVDRLMAKVREAGVAWLDAYVPARSLVDVQSEIDETFGVSLGGARVRVGIVRGHLLEVVVMAPEFASARDEAALEAAEVLVEGLLGERVFDHWVSAVSVAPGRRAGPLQVVSDAGASSGHPVGHLTGLVARAIEGIIQGLPDEPWSRRVEPEAWTLFEAEPELSSDYAMQDDVAVATTRAPELLKCFLERAPFSSLRFSRHDEAFVYLKLECAGDSDTRLRLRESLEERLSLALGPGRGAVIGNGLGIRYVYVNLALEDLEHSLRTVREVAAAQVPTSRGWIQFFDSDWQGEWLGLLPTTPPPPVALSR